MSHAGQEQWRWTRRIDRPQYCLISATGKMIRSSGDEEVRTHGTD
jgi:hypothetical protein